MWNALKEEPKDLRDAVVAQHPVILDSEHDTLAGVLHKLPRCIGVFGARACIVTEASGRQTRQLTADLADKTTVKDLPALLPALAHVQHLVLAFNLDMADDPKAAPGWAGLCAAAVQAMTALTCLSVHMPERQLPWLEHISALRALSCLQIECASAHMGHIGAVLAPLLQPAGTKQDSLPALQSLFCTGIGAANQLSHKDLSRGEGAMLINSLMHAPLTRLSLARSALTATQMLDLTSILQHMTALKALNLNDLAMPKLEYQGQAGLRTKLMVGLAKCTGLQELGIRGLGWAEPCDWKHGSELQVRRAQVVAKSSRHVRFIASECLSSS